QGVDRFDQVRQRAAETIELPHRQDIAFAHEAQRRRQSGPVGFRSRRFVLEHARATGLGEGVELQRQVLIGRRHPRVADGRHSVPSCPQIRPRIYLSGNPSSNMLTDEMRFGEGRRMKKHEILSAQSRAALFDPPTDPAAIVRHYTLSPEDLTLIGQRRRDANRLGFAVHLAYLKFPGRVLGSEETAASEVVAFLAHQLGIESGAYNEYAQRDETRREHLGEIQSHLRVRPFSRDDYRYVAKIATDEAVATDRGAVIVAAMIEALRTRGILLPAPTILERIGLAARARARKQAHKNLIEGLEQ